MADAVVGGIQDGTVTATVGSGGVNSGSGPDQNCQPRLDWPVSGRPPSARYCTGPVPQAKPRHRRSVNQVHISGPTSGSVPLTADGPRSSNAAVAVDQWTYAVAGHRNVSNARNSPSC